MTIVAKARYIRISPRKSNIIAKQIRMVQIEEALNLLRNCNRAPAKPIGKLLESALANAKRDKRIDVDNLYISKILINQGPTVKRSMPRARGRATPIRKRTSHIIIELDER